MQIIGKMRVIIPATNWHNPGPFVVRVCASVLYHQTYCKKSQNSFMHITHIVTMLSAY